MQPKYQFVNYYQHVGIDKDEDRLSARRKIIKALLSNHPDKQVDAATEHQHLIVGKACLLNEGKEIFSNDQSHRAWRYVNSNELDRWFKDSRSHNVNGSGFFDPACYLTWGSLDPYFYPSIPSEDINTKASGAGRGETQSAKDKPSSTDDKTKTSQSTKKGEKKRREGNRKGSSKQTKSGGTANKPRSRRPNPNEARHKSQEHNETGPEASQSTPGASTPDENASENRTKPERVYIVISDDEENEGPARRTRSKTFRSGRRPGMYGNVADQYASISVKSNTPKKRSAKEAGLDNEEFAAPLMERRRAPY